MLHIAILGLVQVHSDNQSRVINAPQLASLLGYLCLNGADGHAISREALIDVLFPELPPLQARRALSDALYRLRLSLGADANSVVSDERTVALCESSVDVMIFRHGITSGTLEEELSALELYRGDLLEQVDDDWALGQRAVLRELMLATLARVCGQLFERGRLADAIIYTHRWVDADPYNETAHRTLMRLYTALNRQDAALHHYDRLCKLLDRELQATPLPETRAVGEALRAPQRSRLSAEEQLLALLRELSSEELHLIELLALLGSNWSAALLQQVLPGEPDVALEPLIRQGLIVVQRGTFAFAQGDLRYLVLADLISVRLQPYLEQIVAALQRLIERVPPPVQVALAPVGRRRGHTGRIRRQILVSWTVDAGESDRQLLVSKGKVALRRHRILRLLVEAKAQGAAPTVQDLARVLEVSERSVEADLAALRQSGALELG